MQITPTVLRLLRKRISVTEDLVKRAQTALQKKRAKKGKLPKQEILENIAKTAEEFEAMLQIEYREIARELVLYHRRSPDPDVLSFLEECMQKGALSPQHIGTSTEELASFRHEVNSVAHKHE